MNVNEEWRAIAGYDGRYEVSSLGRVRSLDMVCENIGSSGYTRRRSGKVLGTSSNPRHYPTVSLPSGCTPVHKLVAAAFLGPKPDGCEICHHDGNRLNASAANLRYATHAENECDKDRHGTRLRGEEHNWTRKLTKEDVREIRLLAPYDTHALLAEHYGVDRSMISSVVRNKCWYDASYVPQQRRVVL